MRKLVKLKTSTAVTVVFHHAAVVLSLCGKRLTENYHAEKTDLPPSVGEEDIFLSRIHFFFLAALRTETKTKVPLDEKTDLRA